MEDRSTLKTQWPLYSVRSCVGAAQNLAQLDLQPLLPGLIVSLVFDNTAL